MLPGPVSRLVVVLSGLFGVSVFVLVLMPSPQPSTFTMEVAKALLQLGVVSVLGVAVSVLVFEYQRARNNADKEQELERRALEYREDLLKSTLARAMNCYSQTKKARRLFRAKGRQRHAEADIVIAEQYDACMGVLNDAQLELENVARDVRNSEPAFSNPARVVESIRLMEKYLSDLIGEYESHRGDQQLREGKLKVQELEHLSNFLVTALQSRFKPEFIVPYHEVQETIRRDLLHPKLPRSET